MASHRKTLIAAAVPVGFLLSGALIWQASYAAFSATTTNTGNTWSAGSVFISDNDSDSAMFNATNLVPGATGNGCIEVTYTGSLTAASIVMDANLTTSSTLTDWVNMTVEADDGGTCAAFVADRTPFVTASMTALNAAAPVDSWADRVTNTRTAYRVTYTLRSDAPDTVQGLSAVMDFSWTATSA